jgi:hypothetical protein
MFGANFGVILAQTQKDLLTELMQNIYKLYKMII